MKAILHGGRVIAVGWAVAIDGDWIECGGVRAQASAGFLVGDVPVTAQPGDLWDGATLTPPPARVADELARAKREKIITIRQEASARIATQFPSLADSGLPLGALVAISDILLEQWQSVGAAGRNPTSKWSSVVAIKQAAQTAINDVNSAATIAAVNAVVVNWP